MDARPTLSRGHATWSLYVAFACMAFLLNGMGAVLPPLQADLRVSRGDVAFYPSLFAAGLIVVGLVGARLVGRIGRAAAIRMAIGAILAGGLMIAAPERPATLVGAVMLGFGAALLIQLVPAVLATTNPHAPAAAIGEANGLASAASVLAPLAVSAALAAGFGWRIGYLAIPLLVLAGFALPIWRLPLSEARESTTGPAAAGASMAGRWVDLLVAVSVEFCMVFWAASAFIAWDGASASQGAALASLFLVGMAVARLLSARIIRLVPDPRNLVLLCSAGATSGFALFWAAPDLAWAAVGLLVAGLGVALLYPTTVSRVVAAWPHAPDRAASRAALASGLAIGGAPFLLAQVSDATGLRTAFLIVPVLLLVLALKQAFLKVRA